MADIFISYASEDRDRAGKIAEALGAQGWSVWWDRKIIAGQAFDQTIESALGSAKCVVVLWSKCSIASEWVKNEAAAGAERGVLVPATLEAVQLPLEFRRRQTADLTNWNGDPADNGFQSVCEGVAMVLGGTAPPRPLRPHVVLTSPPPPPPPPDRRWIFGAIGALVVALGGGVYFLSSGHSTATPEGDNTAQVNTASTNTPPVNLTNTSPIGKVPEGKGPQLANLVAGQYVGDIISDAKGPGKSDVEVIISELGPKKVAVSSKNKRIGTFEVELTRVGTDIQNVGGATVFIAYTEKNPPELQMTVRNEVAYSGKKQLKRAE